MSQKFRWEHSRSSLSLFRNIWALSRKTQRLESSKSEVSTLAWGQNVAHHLFLKIKFYWNTAMPFHICTVCGCFHTLEQSLVDMTHTICLQTQKYLLSGLLWESLLTTEFWRLIHSCVWCLTLESAVGPPGVFRSLPAPWLPVSTPERERESQAAADVGRSARNQNSRVLGPGGQRSLA